MSNITYRRGQAEWALWQLARSGRSHAPASIPAEFLARIKKLLDLDRGHARKELKSKVQAFVDTGRGRSSRDAEFESFDVFCLAIALDLVDAGLLQTEAIHLIRECRAELQDEFEWIIEHYPPATRAPRLAKDYPDLPSYEDKGSRIADTSVFMITRKMALTETLAKNIDEPAIVAPRFADGRIALAETLSLSPLVRSVLVIEIAGTAKLIEAFLARAPRITRARKN